MTLAEALASLERASDDSEAWGALSSEVERLSRRAGVIPRFREDSVEDVQMKLLEMARARGFAHVEGNPESYVFRMLANRSIDLNRSADRRRKRELASPVPRAPLDPPREAPNMDRIGQLYDKALSRREQRYRSHLQQAWHDLDRILDGDTVAQILSTRGIEPTGKAVAKVYKSQERLREAMLAVIDLREGTGKYSRDDAHDYRREVQLLIRCQGRGLSGVSPGRNPSND